MSYSRRQLYAMGETFGDSATSREVGGRIIYGGGGGKSAPAPQPTTTITESGPSTTTLNRTTLNEIPNYLTDASQDLVARGQALSRTPFEAYGGPRVAEFSPLMNQAFQRIGGQQVAGQIGQATGLAGLASQQALGVGVGGYKPYEMGGFDAQRAQQYMNPYMQSVVDIERREAQRVADEKSAALSGQAARQGAFGGSGAALQQRALRRDTAQQLADIQTQGLGRAYDQGLARFGAEEAMREQSRQYGAGYDLSGQNLRLQGAQTALQGAGQLGQLGQQQFGQEMGITQALGTAGDVQRQREQALLDVGYGDFLAAKKDPYEKLAFQQGLVSGVPYSTTQRVSGQEVTQPGKQVQQQFAAPKPAPNAAAQILGTGAALYGATGGSGGGGGGGDDDLDKDGYLGVETPGLEDALTKAKGGLIKRYAVGGVADLDPMKMNSAVKGMSDDQVANTAAMPGLPGLTGGTEQKRREDLRMAAEGQQAPASMTKITSVLSQMSDAELQQYAKLNKSDPYTMALVVAEADRRKNGGMPSEGPPKVVDQKIASMALPEDQGIAQLPVNMEFADGGIIAFQDRGAVPIVLPAGTSPEEVEIVRMQNPGKEVIVADGSDSRFARGPSMAGITQPFVNQSVNNKQNMGAGPAPAPTRSGAPLLDVEGIMALRQTETNRQLAEEAKATKIEQDELARARTAQQADVESARTSYSDREERLKKREEGMKGKEESNVNMAVFEAGLRLMSGIADDGSNNFLSVLAAGAQQGLKGYQGRLEKINASKEKLDDDFSKLYELRQAKVDAAGKELRVLNMQEADIKARAVRNASTMMSALGNEEVNLKTKQFDNMYKTWEQGQQNERARIAAAGNSSEERKLALLEKYPEGTEKGDELRKNLGYLANLGKSNPVLKDPSYIARAKNLAQAEMMLNAITDPEKKAKQQVIVNNMKIELAAMRGVDGSAGGSGSGTLNAADQALLDKYR